MVRENTFSDFSPFGFVKVFSVLVNVVCILEKKAYSADGVLLTYITSSWLMVSFSSKSLLVFCENWVDSGLS